MNATTDSRAKALAAIKPYEGDAVCTRCHGHGATERDAADRLWHPACADFALQEAP